uniref:Uncharacterized protein n=1 Tax=Cyanistes caeruleus TaxID=156563 RepID=A0A8C0UEW3_CYACU
HSQPGLIHSQPGLIHSQPGLIHSWLGLIHSPWGLIHSPWGLIHSQPGLIHSWLGLIHSPWGLIHSPWGLIHSPWGLIHSQQAKAPQPTWRALFRHRTTSAVGQRHGKVSTRTRIPNPAPALLLTPSPMLKNLPWSQAGRALPWRRLQGDLRALSGDGKLIIKKVGE